MDYWQGDIPWASPKDFGSFYLTDTRDHISKAALAGSSAHLVPAGTLLVVFRSGVLQHSLPVTIATQETAINQDLKAFVFSEHVTAEYVGAYLTIFGSKLLPLITKSGATVQSINTEQFRELGIPIPPRQIQDDIVEKLVSALSQKSEVEAKARELLASVDTVLFEELGISPQADPPHTIESRIFRRPFSDVTGQRWDPNFYTHMVRFLTQAENGTHPLRKLGQFISKVQYGISERATKDVVGVPMLRMLNMQDGEWALSDLKFIEMTNEEKRPYLLDDGDILFNRTNSKELVGKCIVYRLAGEYVFASYLMRVVLRERCGLLPEYVTLFMASSLGRIQIDAVSRQIAGMTNINAEEVRNLLIPVPPVVVQERLCQRVAAIRDKDTKIRAQATVDLEQAKAKIEALILAEGATE